MAEDLEALVKKLLERVDRLEAELAAAKRELARKDQIIAALQHRLFGSKSERHHPDQGQLDFGEDVLGKFEPSSSNPTNGKDRAAGAKAGGAERRSKRDLLPHCLRVEVTKVIIPDEVLANPDAFIEIGELHHDELAIQKSEIYWLRQIRKKYKLRDDREAAPVVAPAPLPSVPGTLCDPGLLAMILADKYVYHDPHYRQSARFLHRFGAELSRQTLNTWTHAAVRHLEPLRAAITNELRLAEVIQIDETPMFYLSPGLGRTARGYMWCYRDPSTGTVAFDWRVGRGHESMIEFLGLDDETVDCLVRLIQCDGYSAYEAIGNRYREILLGACLAHIRRKFYDARSESPELAETILALIRKLYAIESRMRTGPYTDACRILIRSGHARPLRIGRGWVVRERRDGKWIDHPQIHWPDALTSVRKLRAETAVRLTVESRGLDDFEDGILWAGEMAEKPRANWKKAELIARNFLFQPINSHPAEGPGPEGVRLDY